MSSRKIYNNLYEEYIVEYSKEFYEDISSSGLYLGCKRFLDIVISLITLVITSPVLIIFGIAIKLETPGPIFYFQERVGFKGKYFQIVKLRSMGIDAEKKGAQWADKNDSRVTKVGAFIRKTRIDEIPQLYNVLKGEMSLIGPRPERPMFTALFNEEIPAFTQRLVVKPGITGWAQVNGGYEITAEKKLKLDLYYINHISITMDMRIIFKTIKVVLTGNGAR